MKKKPSPLVFIVEDNEVYAAMIRYTLESSNYRTEVFISGEDCMQNIYKMPDIVILDYNLLIMTGLDVLKEIKSINPDIYVLFLSAQEDLNVGINSLKYGAYDYVIKDHLAFDNLIIALNKIKKMNQMIEESQRTKKNKKIAMALSIGCIALSLLIKIFL